ncbi:MAG: SDR family oxidoreductase [Phycisphaerales bacterium]|nr:SDR family oxidoreductase [Phycisphaerales bacterium]
MTDTQFQALRGRRALVTGGAGFIGSHLATALVAHGCRVRVLDSLVGGYRDNVPDGAEFVHASILDDASLRRAMTGCDYVFHQAAMVSVPESVDKPEECMRVNVLGTAKVLEAARDLHVGRVLFAASAAAYGNTPSLPSKETDLPDSWSPYAMSKVAGELLLQTFARCYGMSTVSLRYFNIYGPRQDPNSPYAAVISAFSRRLLAGTMPTVLGDGQQTRDFTFIDNVVRANLLAATSPRPLAGEVINIGTGRRSSLLDVLGAMGKALGIAVNPGFAPPRAGDVRHSCAEISRAKELLGYEPVVHLQEGLARTLEWAKVAWAPASAR